MAKLEMGGKVRRWVAMKEIGAWLSWRRVAKWSWVARLLAKLVARLLATAALWVRIKTSLKNTKWAP